MQVKVDRPHEFGSKKQSSKLDVKTSKLDVLFFNMALVRVAVGIITVQGNIATKYEPYFKTNVFVGVHSEIKRFIGTIFFCFMPVL